MGQDFDEIDVGTAGDLDWLSRLEKLVLPFAPSADGSASGVEGKPAPPTTSSSNSAEDALKKSRQELCLFLPPLRNHHRKAPPEGFSKDTIRTVNGFTTKLNSEKQLKHIPGSPYYTPGKSIFLGTLQEAQELVNQFAGTGEWIEPNRERIDFNQAIGMYVNYLTGETTATNKGLIHFSKNGTHIVPCNPNGGK